MTISSSARRSGLGIEPLNHADQPARRNAELVSIRDELDHSARAPLNPRAMNVSLEDVNAEFVAATRLADDLRTPIHDQLPSISHTIESSLNQRAVS